jgi:hypothetical protein
MIKGIDWGGYDYKLPLSDLQKLGDVQFVISQSGGAGTPAIIQGAKGLGMITGLYYWNSALVSVQAQIDQFSAQIDLLKPDMIILDHEHWWKSWEEYWQAIAGTIPWSQVQKLPPEKISENGRMVAEGIKLRWAGKYYMTYSSNWFIGINGYSPSSPYWIKKYPYFPATYPDYGVPPYTLSWEDIRANKIFSKTYGLTPLTDYKPDLTVPITSWEVWQYSSRIKIPGEAYSYDWDVFNGTLDELKIKCGLIPAPPGELTDKEKLDRLWSAHPELWPIK